jgi:hypothetical protein
MMRTRKLAQRRADGVDLRQVGWTANPADQQAPAHSGRPISPTK